MIRIENLRKEYDAKTVALDNIDLVFEDSTFVALLGPSGCGKTTTLNCIAGLLEPTSGKIFFGDKDVTRLQPKDRNIGILITDHNVEETLCITDRAYLLFEGRILFHGTPEELAENQVVRDRYLTNSFKLRKKDFDALAAQRE